MSTYTVTAWDIKPSGTKTLVQVDVEATARWEAQETGWLRLATAPGAYNIQVVDVVAA